MLTNSTNNQIDKHPRDGESYGRILQYFYPELVTSFIIYSAISLLDNYFVSQLPIVEAYATSGVTNTLFMLITKVADAFAVGMAILCGQYNGVGQFKDVGKTVTDAFWTTCIIGATIALALYFGANAIFLFYGIPPEMIKIGVPFLKLRSISVFFNFVVFALIGFFRGIKNTRMPMFLFMLGAATFAFFDYVFIFGKCGFPCYAFQGSAMAYIMQYVVMLIAALVYIFITPDIKKYAIELFTTLDRKRIMNLLTLSWPVMLDKASLSISQSWLLKMIGSIALTNTQVTAGAMISSLSIIRDVERFAFLPGLAFAQIITFLISNDYRANNWDGIKNNVKKVMLMSFAMVITLIAIFSIWPVFFVSIFDKHKTFTTFASTVIPYIGILILFDLLQLILSAALRGAADVRTVMWVRILVTGLFFIPVSYFLSTLTFENVIIKFIVIYGSLHIGNLIMSLLYIKRFLSGKWKRV